MEVEPLYHTKLEDLGLNTCSHDLFPSSREFSPTFILVQGKPQPLPNFLSLDVDLGGKRGTDPPINPYRNNKWELACRNFLKKRKTFFFTDPGDGVKINPDGVARLYLTRRSLEVLRKFHWKTLGGRSNQLSHVSSPLLSKPVEY
ncbi:hypothetical protein Tco_1093344 [Tanacetum coccineum]|uniref:Uncharacterized protein n=1 Tax=Tanacetum coccineum TaxID=301880 RepID=A0ABQ5IDM5_9ASTR